MKKKYYLILDYGQEGLRLEEFDTKEEVWEKITSGETYGQPFQLIYGREVNLDD
jgi:hypothetical protein